MLDEILNRVKSKFKNIPGRRNAARAEGVVVVRVGRQQQTAAIFWSRLGKTVEWRWRVVEVGCHRV